MEKLILLGMILSVSLLGIYLLAQNISDRGGLLTPTKPSDMMLNILNIYGTLEDYSSDGNMTTFRIKSEAANCKLNNSNIEMTANSSIIRELYHIESHNFTNVEQLEIGKVYNFYTDETHYAIGIYNGTFFDSHDKEDYISLLNVADGAPFASIYANFTRAEYVKSTLLANSSFFAKNEKYMFYFHKSPEEKIWKINIEKDDDGVRKQCSTFHERDLMVNQMIETIEPKGEKIQSSDPLQSQTMAVEIITTKIESGKPTELKVGLINKQNNEISFRIKAAKLVNEQASQWYGYWYQLPPYEERLKNAVIVDCSVNFDSSESSILANSTEILSFTVTCPKGVDVTKTYEICDNYEEKRNCRTETANRTDDLMLWGEIEFTDELGIKHVIPEQGVMKQMLELQ